MSLITPKQAAELVGVSASLVYEWCSDGLLPHYRLGRKQKRGKLMIERGDLDRFLESCKREGAASEPEPPLRHIVSRARHG